MSRHPHGAYTPAELQAQYSARAAVPEHPEIFARWRRDSAAFRDREARAPRPDLVYGERTRQRIDLFHPDGTSPAPLHVFFHGGYWQAMQPGDFSFVARALNARGIAVAVVGYSLCPEVTLATIVEEAYAAIAWLDRQRPDLGVDDRAFQVSGHSAGGHLAAMLATTPAPIDWIAPISGVFDLEPLVPTAINDALGLATDAARALSPMHAKPALPLAIDAWVGGEESDEFHRQSAAFVEAWRGSASAAHVHTVSGCNHFTVLDVLFAADGPLVERAVHQAGV